MNSQENGSNPFAATERLSAEEKERFREMQSQYLASKGLKSGEQLGTDESIKTEEEIRADVSNFEDLNMFSDYISRMALIPSKSGEPHEGGVIAGEVKEGIAALENATEIDDAVFSTGYMNYMLLKIPSTFGLRTKWKELFEKAVRDKKEKLGGATVETKDDVSSSAEKTLYDELKSCENITDFLRVIQKQEIYMNAEGVKVTSEQIKNWAKLAQTIDFTSEGNLRDDLMRRLLEDFPDEQGVKMEFRRIMKIPY